MNLKSFFSLSDQVENAALICTANQQNSNPNGTELPDARLAAHFKAMEISMSKQGLYAIVAVLAIAIIGLGIYVYQQESKPSGIEIQVNEQGISVDTN
jgi:hypothetical protein